MRVFVTGASGFIGSAAVQDLLAGGHEVVGLARSDASASALESGGASVRRGSLDDLDSLRAGAADADGVVHLAFDNSFVDYAAAVTADLDAVEAMGSALRGSGKPFVVTSGTLSLAFTPGLGTEADVLDPALPRVGSEHAAIALADDGVRSSIVRLAPCVHDGTRAGLASGLIAVAREWGVSAYVGDGANRWPGVHRLDAAHLFRLALESAPAGTRLHAVGDEGVPLRDIAEVIGRHLDLPVVSITAEEAADHFGFLGLPVPLDTRRRAQRPNSCWDGSRPALASWPTSTPRSTTEARRPTCRPSPRW
jgi:nucleoside-diphosphate-sugar epimerase